MLKYLAAQGVKSLLIPDDNFYRNPNKKKILQTFIDLRNRGIEFDIFIQTDMKVIKKGSTEGEVDKEFMKMCKEAGVSMIFTGAESFNYDVLKSMDKGQNIRNGEDTFIEDMRRQRQAWNDQGITVMFTCILGNKHDRPGIGRKTAEIAQEIGVNIVVPYILCVLPGSQDSKTFRDHPEIADIDPDFSHHSSTQPVVQWKHKDAMTKKQVMQEYRELLDTFYQPKNIPLAGISLSAVRQFVWFMI